jgi:tRNA threonylcarbamoyladenosine biosynthesis protein TsaB
VLILGIETSTTQSSVCIGNERGPVATASLNQGRAHAEYLAPAIQFCLDRAGRTVGGLAGIAVGLGPGLFTGMRVGIATAQALAHARQLPVIGLNALDLLAFPVRYIRADRLICAVIDARRSELFWAFYRPSLGGVQRITDLRVGPPEKLAGEIEAVREDVLCVGDGALLVRSLLESAGAAVAAHGHANPTAWSLVELALPRFIREETQHADDLRPVYVRKADARISWKNRGALFGGTAGAPSRGAGPDPDAPSRGGAGPDAPSRGQAGPDAPSRDHGPGPGPPS